MRKELSFIALFITAAIWGFAFVAQRKGMETLDPFIFNGIRFSLGAIFLLLIFNKRLRYRSGFPLNLGLVLFAGATFQQIGIAGTSAGNAGFITGLYIIFVPILGLFRSQKLSRQLIVALIFALVGLFLINDNTDLSVTFSNGLVLVGAVFWAIHLQLIDKLLEKYDPIYLAFSQYLVCALLSFIFGLFYNIVFKPELLTALVLFQNIRQVIIPLLYSGLISVGIAYSLQVIAQKGVKPTPAAIILSLESLFALLGGWWLLKEIVTPPGFIGAVLLFAAMLISITAKRETLKNQS